MSKLFIAMWTGIALSSLTISAVAAEKTEQTKVTLNVARASADADYDASRVRCRELSGNDRDICVQTAKAERTKAKGGAKSKYQGTGEAKLEAREDAIDADFKVAKEKCDSLAGDAKNVCSADAKAAHTKAEAVLEADEKTMKADYKVAKAHCATLPRADRRACLKEAKVKFDT
jgi:hypothetical protein